MHRYNRISNNAEQAFENKECIYRRFSGAAYVMKKVEETHRHVPSAFFLILKKIDEKFSHNLRLICCLNV